MSEIRINSIKIKNYRSFGKEQSFVFPDKNYKKPVAIVGYNNSGKTNLMNCLLLGIGSKFISKETFDIADFHNLEITNIPYFNISVSSSSEKKYDKKDASLNGTHELIIQTDGQSVEGAKLQSKQFDGKDNYQAFGANKYFNVFYINFHTIKDEIKTQRTSWGNLTSFLSKHIKRLVDIDTSMSKKRNDYETEVKNATDKVLENSRLSEFVATIKRNYSTNLRDNNCEVSFGLPDYEDIFLQMIFKIGLNGDDKKPVPIDHFGDGYISMFVMAVIQAIAESNTTDKCLFLFEGPESFLHENHQEYFYKTVLCNLSNEHQVIYTTHSDKMVDIFDTKGIIRLEFDEVKKQTVKQYNNINNFDTTTTSVENDELITLSDYNNFIKFIEPNLNKILFSRKVILVEGANDILVYKYLIEKYVASIKGKKYAETYLNFLNIAIIVHQGKSTAWLLIDLCKHFKLDYFAINDLDFDNKLLVSQLSAFSTEDELKADLLYTSLQDEPNNGEKAKTKKQKMTVNWKLINSAGIDKIHFNIPKLETVLEYTSNDKNSLKIWEKIKTISLPFQEAFFPQSLINFLEFSNFVLVDNALPPENSTETSDDDLPF